MTLIDGKNEGYEQFEGTKNFYAEDKQVEGIKNFYEKVFEYKRKNKKDKEFKNRTHILILEEYSSILQDLSKKEEEEIKKMVSRILKMREVA